MGDDRPEPQRTGRTTGSSVLTPPTGLPVVPNDPGMLVEPVQSVEPVAAVPPPAAAWTTPDTPSIAPVPATYCVCGHEPDAHEHWRRGTDCGICGAASCSGFRRRGGRVCRLLRSFRLIR